MPRDFIPCVYQEWQWIDEATPYAYRRYEVTEAFAVSLCVTRTPALVITGDSHTQQRGTVHLKAGFEDEPPGPWEQTRQVFQRLVFRDFYAAMAALEDTAC